MNVVRLGLVLGILLASAAPAAAQTFEDRLIELINQERVDAGQAPLKRHPALDAAAEGHAQAMATRNFFAFCDPDLKTVPDDRVAAAGFPDADLVGEVIGANLTTPEAMVANWMAGPNASVILDPRFRHMGVGYAFDAADQGNVSLDDGFCGRLGSLGPYFHYWVLDLAVNDTVSAVIIDDEAYQVDHMNQEFGSDVHLYVHNRPEAEWVRFRNRGGGWSRWFPVSMGPVWVWQLAEGPGEKIVDMQEADWRWTVPISDHEDSIVQINSTTVGIPDGEGGGAGVRLLAASPNPFRSATRVAFALPEAAAVHAEVLDVRGRRVAVIADDGYAAGSHELQWDGRDDTGRATPSGLYFLRLTAGDETRTTKLLLRR